jgi:hypothetical protein
MGKYSNYDPKEGVIFTDLTGLKSSRELTDEIVDEAIAIARNLPKKPWIVVCWKDVQMDQANAEHYGMRVKELMKYIRGVVRYEANEIHTRLFIRSQTVKHHLQGARTNIYPTRADALAAIRNGEVEALPD